MGRARIYYNNSKLPPISSLLNHSIIIIIDLKKKNQALVGHVTESGRPLPAPFLRFLHEQLTDPFRSSATNIRISVVTAGPEEATTAGRASIYRSATENRREPPREVIRGRASTEATAEKTAPQPPLSVSRLHQTTPVFVPPPPFNQQLAAANPH